MKTILRLVCLLLLCFALVGFAASPCEHSDKEFHCVHVERVYDGDTLTVSIPNVHPLLGHMVGVRVLGVDTPEIRGKTECEKARAVEARDYVKRLLKSASNVSLMNVDRDKYFRVLAEVHYDGKNLSDALLKKGFAYPYEGDTKKEIDWCKPLPPEVMK